MPQLRLEPANTMTMLGSTACAHEHVAQRQPEPAVRGLELPKFSYPPSPPCTLFGVRSLNVRVGCVWWAPVQKQPVPPCIVHGTRVTHSWETAPREKECVDSAAHSDMFAHTGHQRTSVCRDVEPDVT